MPPTAVNQKAAGGDGPRLGAHWRTVSWALLDKSLQLFYGVAFLLLVVRALPPEEFGLQAVAGTILLVLSQFFRSLVLVPLVKYVAEARHAGRVAATGTLLYVSASVMAAFVLWAGRGVWATAFFHKPELAAVLVPSACLLAVGSPRDAATSNLEGQRRLRAVFSLDLTYYLIGIVLLVVWRTREGPRTAIAVQWVQAAAAGLGAAIAVVATRGDLWRRPATHEARRILRFGTSFLGSGFGATLAAQADMLLAGRLMDARGVATYNVAKQIFRGFNVLAQAINQVLMPAVSRLHVAGRERDLRVLFEKSVCFLSLAVWPICALLVVAARPLFGWLFEHRYGDSVPAFQILVASAMTLPLASVGSPFLTGMGELRHLLWITWAGLLLGIACAAVWIPLWGPVGAASATLVAAVFGMLARAVVLRPQLGFSLGGILARIGDVEAFARRRGVLPSRRSG